MNCWNCGVPADVTMAFCIACGVAMDPSDDDIDNSGAVREERIKGKRATEWARDKLVLGAFLLVSAVAVRIVFHRPRTEDYFTSYRLPYALVDAEGIDPPQSVDADPFPVPLPTYDPAVHKTKK